MLSQTLIVVTMIKKCSGREIRTTALSFFYLLFAEV